MTAEEILAMFEKAKQMKPEELAAFAAQQAQAGAAKQDCVTASAGNYFSRYVEKECKTEEERSSLVSDIDSFWNRLNGYIGNNSGRAYGLAVGRVQSGKTRNYIGLLFKAIDEGFNTIIVLTSKNNLLAKQTHDRVSSWFGVEELDVPNFHSLTREVEGGGIEWIGGEFSPNRVNVGVIIKNVAGHLTNLKAWLASIAPDRLKSMRMLFIDDESDAATPNSNVASEPDIASEADVRVFSSQVAEKESVSGGPYAIVAQWILELSKKDLNDSDVEKMQLLLRQNANYKGLFDSISQDSDVQRILSLEGEVRLCGENRCKAGIVVGVFKHRAGRRTFPNQSVFRDFLNYLFDVRIERSKINHSIAEIVSTTDPKRQPIFLFDKMLYVGYTATPFANMLNEDPTKDPLCPDCIKPLSIGPKYFGLDRIFGSESSYDGRSCRMNIVRSIENDEEMGWVAPIQGGDLRIEDVDELDPRLVRETNVAKEGEPEQIRMVEWKSLKDAIKWAFCTAAARRVSRLAGSEAGDFATRKYRWTTMLFNISHLADQDEGAHIVQQAIVKKYLGFVTTPQCRELFVEECMALWREATSDFTDDDFDRACPGYGAHAQYPDPTLVEKELREWFVERCSDKVQIVQMNAAAQDQADYNDETVGCGGDILWIVCGGNAISRGLTLEGLTVSYYDRIRRSTTVDSITQMGRWFGYRQGYELLPRIWMSEQTVAEMKNICRIEGQLHDELRSLFEDDDKSSIRAGREVVSIRYFGRRLSGRDANGMQIGSQDSRGVFDCVSNDPSSAFECTKRFLSEYLPLDRRWRRPSEGYNKQLHERHKYIWRSVDREHVAQYLQDMGRVAFRGSSLTKSQGLFREVMNSVSSWTVVVGAPDPAGMSGTPMQVSVVDGVSVCARNNRIENCADAAVRTGHGTQTVQAYLSNLPDEIIESAEQEVKSKYSAASNLDGKMETVNAAYKIAFDRNLRDELAPILLIDFVNGNENGCYVQVSFYWYGHDTGSFFKAIINPTNPSLVPEIVQIVQNQGYVSYSTLRRRLQAAHQGVVDCDLWQDIESSCRDPLSKIGIVPDGQARTSVLSPKVVFDKKALPERYAGIVSCEGEAVGLDLYRKILIKGWNDYDGEYLNYKTLTENNYDYIIAYDWIRHQYLWQQFEAKYLPLTLRITARRVGTNDDGCNWDAKSVDLYSQGMEKLEEYESGDLADVLKQATDYLIASAEQGYPLAKYQLGRLCASNDLQKSKDYFTDAIPGLKQMAETGSEEALSCLRNLNVSLDVSEEADKKLLQETKLMWKQISDSSPDNVEYLELCFVVVQSLKKLVVHGNVEAKKMLEDIKLQWR